MQVHQERLSSSGSLLFFWALKHADNVETRAAADAYLREPIASLRSRQNL